MKSVVVALFLFFFFCVPKALILTNDVSTRSLSLEGHCIYVEQTVRDDHFWAMVTRLVHPSSIKPTNLNRKCLIIHLCLVGFESVCCFLPVKHTHTHTRYSVFIFSQFYKDCRAVFIKYFVYLPLCSPPAEVSADTSVTAHSQCLNKVFLLSRRG